MRAHRRTMALALSTVVAVAGAPGPADAVQPRQYQLDVRLDPERGRLDVSARVALHLGEDESTITFDLYEGFSIVECTIDQKPARCTRERSPEGPTSRKIAVPLPAGAERGVVDLELKYNGGIAARPGWGEPNAEGPFMDDALGPDRVELALYSNWYPGFGFGNTFDVEMKVTIPSGWAVTAIGEEDDRRPSPDGTTTVWGARAVNDVVIVASPELRREDVETAAGRVQIHHTRLPKEYLLREARDTEETLALFTTVLGESSGGQTVQHVYSPRDWGQGFARPGLIVVSEGRVLRALEENPDVSFLHGHAHEAGHFWWRYGSGQGDWINETFAEYFALLAVRSIQGEDEFRRILDEAREAVRGLPDDAPALAVVPFINDGPGYTIRYHKGAVMLDAFRRHIGDEAFLAACRVFYETIRGQGRSAGTDDFRGHWRDVLADDALLTSWLDSSGSAPISSGR